MSIHVKINNAPVLYCIHKSYINVTLSPMSPQKPNYFYFAFPDKTFEIG